jgi:hypothetical protein
LAGKFFLILKKYPLLQQGYSVNVILSSNFFKDSQDVETNQSTIISRMR